MKRTRVQLDEMLEQKTLKIERYGLWIGYWGLVLSMLIQLALPHGDNLAFIAGEFSVFVAISLFLLVATISRGLWSRGVPPAARHTLWLSFWVGLCIFTLRVALHAIRQEITERAMIMNLLLGAAGALVCYAVTSLLERVCQKRMEKLENESAGE